MNIRAQKTTKHLANTPAWLGLLVLCCLSASDQVYAVDAEENSDDWYQFEVIIFEHLRSDRKELRYEGVKYLPQSKRAKASVLQSRNPLVESFTAQSGALPVPMQEAKLQQAYLALNRSSRSRVYSFSAWKQKLNLGDEPPPCDKVR